MAILSTDSFIARQIEEKLKVILPKCYIIDEVLKDFDSVARENFKEAFCGENPQYNINVGYSFPQNPVDLNATYVVQLSTATETGGSLGNIQGDYNENSGDEYVGSVISKLDEETDRLYFEFDKELSEIPYSQDIAFDNYDNPTIEGNRLYFNHKGNERWLGLETDFYYLEKTGNSHGLVKGFVANENIVVVGLSHNVDTARCLDAILKMILIISRESLEEQNGYQLQNLAFGDMSPIFSEGEKPIFGRPVTISYTATHTIDYNLAREIKDIIIRERMRY
ncbi:hypothetical protein KQUDLBSD_CDS0072 [Staphylococcus phage PG-2021_40]